MTINLALMLMTVAAAQAGDPPGRRVEPPPPVNLSIANTPKGRWLEMPAWPDSRHHGITFNAEPFHIQVERFDDASDRTFSLLMQVEVCKAGQACGSIIYSLWPQDIAAVPKAQRAALWRRHLKSMVEQAAASSGLAPPALPLEPVVKMLSK
ncbi:hypothetical protein [Sphingomonas beigongshangi]|uniref:hypothetical protein n=1 Tax=Sphingomonas beigongshangi TaxID=2782540 RepID=UPI00193C8649|nr:hypothetical protein [Sphingomonas beigongshangi]